MAQAKVIIPSEVLLPMQFSEDGIVIQQDDLRAAAQILHDLSARLKRMAVFNDEILKPDDKEIAEAIDWLKKTEPESGTILEFGTHRAE